MICVVCDLCDLCGPPRGVMGGWLGPVAPPPKAEGQEKLVSLAQPKAGMRKNLGIISLFGLFLGGVGWGGRPPQRGCACFFPPQNREVEMGCRKVPSWVSRSDSMVQPAPFCQKFIATHQRRQFHFMLIKVDNPLHRYSADKNYSGGEILQGKNMGYS